MSGNSNLPGWRFFLPLIFQAGLILAVPGQAFYTSITGRIVILQTIPVDPYDLLRGYSQTLRYDISQVNNLETIPGWDNLNLVSGERFYVILEAPKLSVSEGKLPPAWLPVEVRRDLPSDLPSNRIALQGEYNSHWIDYGLETYYMPEDKRKEINAQIREIQREEERQFVVEVKVDSKGNAVPVSLWVGDRNYRF